VRSRESSQLGATVGVPRVACQTMGVLALLEGLGRLAAQMWTARVVAFLLEHPSWCKGQVCGYLGDAPADGLQRLVGRYGGPDLVRLSPQRVAEAGLRLDPEAGAIIWPVAGPQGKPLAWVCAIGGVAEEDRLREGLTLSQVGELVQRLLTQLPAGAEVPPPASVASAVGPLGIEAGSSEELVVIEALDGRVVAVSAPVEQWGQVSVHPRAESLFEALVAPADVSKLEDLYFDALGAGRAGPVKTRLGGGSPGVIAWSCHLLFERSRPVGLLWYGQRALLEPTLEPRPRAPARSGKWEAKALELLGWLGQQSFRNVLDAVRQHLKAAASLAPTVCGAFLEPVSGGVRLVAAWPRRRIEGLRFAVSVRSVRKVLAEPSWFPPRALAWRELFGAMAWKPGRALIAGRVELGGEIVGWLVFCIDDKAGPAAELRHFLDGVATSLARAWSNWELKRVRRQLRLSRRVWAYQDPLTGLPNALALRRRLERVCQRAAERGEKVALALIDLDRFKHFNDTLGYAAADRLLQVLAGRLAEKAGRKAWVARVSGDRFAVVLAGAWPRREIEAWFRDVVATIREPIQVDGHQAHVTASTGVSIFPDDALDEGGLLQHADTALATAKSRGRDELVVYSELSLRIHPGSSRLEHALQGALAAGELELRFQPEYSAEGEVVCLEGLLTWNRPRLGRCPAERFIATAERTGLIIPIGEWVLGEACRWASQWRRVTGKPVRVAVNVSAVQLTRSDFVDVLAETLKATHLEPSLLEIEITENSLVEEAGEAIWALTRIRDLGVTVALDDFGKGYSSLGYLRFLPISVLKLDRSFLPRSGSARRALALVRSVVAMAHRLGLTVVGEGVETAQQLSLLLQVRCDRVQGFYLSPPVMPDQVESLLASRPSPFVKRHAGEKIPGHSN